MEKYKKVKKKQMMFPNGLKLASNESYFDPGQHWINFQGLTDDSNWDGEERANHLESLK